MTKRYKAANINRTEVRNKVKVPDKVYDNIVRKKGERYRGQFPAKYPFWARLRIGKQRTTLVIDDEVISDKKNTKKRVNGFVHREATSVYHKGFEVISPNPDKNRAKKGEDMYLKSPRKLPQKLIMPHEKTLSMPDNLKRRYAKNNRKKLK